MERRACERCVLDGGLASFIEANGQAAICDYCGSTSPTTILVSDLADHISDELTAEFSDVEVEMVSYDNETERYLCDTFSSAELLREVVCFDVAHEVLFDDIVDYLPDQTWCRKQFRPSDIAQALLSGWDDFKDMVKYRTRYLFTDAPPSGRTDSEVFDLPYYSDEGVPASLILEALGAIINKAKLHCTLPAGTTIYRAHPHKYAEFLEGASRLGPPPTDKSLSSRMSPAGIVMFYAALLPETAIREIVCPSTEAVTVAQFHPTRELNLLDLTSIPSRPSFFTDRELHHGIPFMRDFVADLTKPVVSDGREHIEYVPSQVVTEYIRHRYRHPGGARLDGIRYPSAKNNNPAFVLFFDSSECGSVESNTTNVTLMLNSSEPRRISGDELLPYKPAD